jgi:hypothetical protein
MQALENRFDSKTSNESPAKRHMLEA